MKYLTPRKVFDRYFTEAEERTLFRCIRRVDDILAKRDLYWMQFLRHSGVRISVAAGMTVGDAKAAIKTDYFTVRGEINKGGKTYQFYCIKEAKRALENLLKLRRSMGLSINDEDPLIVNRRGGALSVRSFENRMAEWCQQAGMPRGGSPHWWRHTKAKRIIKQSEANNPLMAVMLALGQSDINSAVIYSLPDLEDMEQIQRASA